MAWPGYSWWLAMMQAMVLCEQRRRGVMVLNNALRWC